MNPVGSQRARIRGSRHRAGHSSGFTVVELLVVTAIIIVLLSIVLVALSAATRTSQKARTQALMDSMKKALIRFKGDIGYYPPVLGVSNTSKLRDLIGNSVPDPYLPTQQYVDIMQEYYSTCTLADYLIGYGGHNQDGYGIVRGASVQEDWDSEIPPAGIRSPGPDGVWGATNGLLPTNANYGALIRRMGGPAFPDEPGGAIDRGKVFGPYLELKDERLLAGVSYDGGLHTYFKGDTLPDLMQNDETEWDAMPKAIVDYWGMPIRYYRRPYPVGAMGQSYRAVFTPATGAMDPLFVPKLSDIFVLRPWTMQAGSEIIGRADGDGKTATTTSLESGEFALLSSGPDKLVGSNNHVTFDEDGYNEDNMVEVGP